MPDAVAEVRLADAEPFRLLLAGATEAARIFDSLIDADLDATPGRVRDGITELFRALAEFRGEAPPRKVPDEEPARYGLVIEFPGPPATGPAVINPWLISAFEVTPEGERQVLPTRMTLRILPDEIVTADVVLLAGEDEKPIGVREMPAVRDGDIATVALRYEVAAMRIRGTD